MSNTFEADDFTLIFPEELHSVQVGHSQLFLFLNKDDVKRYQECIQTNGNDCTKDLVINLVITTFIKNDKSKLLKNYKSVPLHKLKKYEDEEGRSWTIMETIPTWIQDTCAELDLDKKVYSIQLFIGDNFSGYIGSSDTEKMATRLNDITRQMASNFTIS